MQIKLSCQKLEISGTFCRKTGLKAVLTGVDQNRSKDRKRPRLTVICGLGPVFFAFVKTLTGFGLRLTLGRPKDRT